MSKLHPRGSSSNRLDDDEVLFTTLILMHGEPPTPPQYYRGPERESSFQENLIFAHEMKHYGYQIKDTMGELGHEPNQGLFTSYIHWAKEQWDAKQHEQEITESETRSA